MRGVKCSPLHHLFVSAVIGSFSSSCGLDVVGCCYTSLRYYSCGTTVVTFRSAAATGPGLLQPRQLLSTAQASIKEPSLPASSLGASNDNPASSASIACLCRAAGKPWMSPAARILSASHLPLPLGVRSASPLARFSHCSQLLVRGLTSPWW